MKYSILLLFTVVFILSLGQLSFVMADTGATSTSDTSAGVLIKNQVSSVETGNPISTTNPVEIIAFVTKTLLGILGAAALLMFIYGGSLWMFSNGEEDKMKKGRGTLLWATFGLALVLSSYGILSFIFNQVSNATK